MSKPENPSVHPLNPTNDATPGAFCPEPGISLRDHFAGCALAILPTPRLDRQDPDLPRKVARCAYAIADAMLAERIVVQS